MSTYTTCDAGFFKALNDSPICVAENMMTT